MSSPGLADSRSRFLARLSYLGVILLATLSGLEPDFDQAQVLPRLARAFDLGVAARDVVDGFRNLALFAGWGVVWMITAPGNRLLRRVLGATVTGALLSTGVEATQLLSPTRTTSILDVMTNTTGALAGALFVLLAAWAVYRQRSSRSFVGLPAFVFAGAYTGAVALEAFVPLFGQEALAGGTGGPLARLSHALGEFDPTSLWDLPLGRVALMAPAGAFWVAALVEGGKGYRSAWHRVALTAPIFALLVELMRGASSQPIHAGSALVHAVSVILGAWAAALWIPALTVRLRGRARPQALLVGYGVLLLLWSWRPFVPETSLAAFLVQFDVSRLIPLTSHAMRVDFFSVVDVVRQFLVLLPVGALLAVWPLRRAGWLSGPLPAVYLACALEVGQLFVAARFFDVTDAILGSAGALIGWAIVARSGFRPHGETLPPPAGFRRRAGR